MLLTLAKPTVISPPIVTDFFRELARASTLASPEQVAFEHPREAVPSRGLFSPPVTFASDYFASFFADPRDPRDTEITAARKEVGMRVSTAVAAANRSAGLNPIVMQLRERLNDDAFDEFHLFVRHDRTVAALNFHIAVEPQRVDLAIRNLRNYAPLAAQPAV